jgi:hypothetical protein
VVVTRRPFPHDGGVIPRRTGALISAGAICLSGLGTASGEVRAPAAHVALVYEAGPGCLDAAEFKASVISRLGYDPFAEGASARVVVRIRPAGTPVAGSIAWSDVDGKATGEQGFPSSSRDCLHLSRAMAFALAVQIELLATRAERAHGGATSADTLDKEVLGTGNKEGQKEGQGGPPGDPSSDSRPSERSATPTDERAKDLGRAEPESQPPRPGPSLVTPPAQPASAPLARTSATPRAPVWSAGVGASWAIGVLSSPVGVGRLFGGVGLPHLSAELSAELSLPATVWRPGDGAGVSQRMALAGAAVCAGSAPWALCALVKGGAVRLAGEEIALRSSAWVWVGEAGARLALTKSLGARFFVSARAEGLLLVNRWTATLDQMPVWTSPRFAGVFGLDAGVRFP